MAFGGVWKESLSELSGGQKSLLALSLILAMLLFKPAPIYILDEARVSLHVAQGRGGKWSPAMGLGQWPPFRRGPAELQHPPLPARPPRLPPQPRASAHARPHT